MTRRSTSRRTTSSRGQSRIVQIIGAIAVLAIAAVAAIFGIDLSELGLFGEATAINTPRATAVATALPTTAPSGGAPVSFAYTPGPITVSYPTMPRNLTRAEVHRVVDGDTVHVMLDGRRVTLRLIGMDTPETVAPNRPVDCFGREASDRAKTLLEGQTVLLETDPSQDELDRYGRMLAYVWFQDGRMFNMQMIAEGYAHEYTYRTAYRYQSQFRAAQREAQQGNRGLWSPDTCAGQP